MQRYIKKDRFCLFDLMTIFSGHKLLINISTLIVSLVPGDRDTDEYAIVQRILTEGDIRMLLPLLEFPSCCRQEVLKASYDCAYDFLLQSLPLSGRSVNPQWDELVQTQRECLYSAQEKKDMRTEMRGVYNAVHSLRQKLEPFGLAVRVRRNGYYLTPLVKGSQGERDVNV